MPGLPSKVQKVATAQGATLGVKKKTKPVNLNSFGYDDDSSESQSDDENFVSAGATSAAARHGQNVAFGGVFRCSDGGASSTWERPPVGGLFASSAAAASSSPPNFGGASSSTDQVPPFTNVTNSSSSSTDARRVADHELFSYHNSGGTTNAAEPSTMTAAFDQLFDPHAECDQPVQNFNFDHEIVPNQQGRQGFGDSFVKQRETWNILEQTAQHERAAAAYQDMQKTALHMQLAGHVNQNVEELEDFWSNEIQRIEKYKSKDFKTYPFKRRKVKTICKLDNNDKCISNEVPPVIAKATELFVMELTMRAKIVHNQSRSG